MPNIHFTQLEVHRREGNFTYELIMNFDQTPAPEDPRRYRMRLVTAFYDSTGRLIGGGSGITEYGIGSNLYPKISVGDALGLPVKPPITVKAWIVGNELISEEFVKHPWTVEDIERLPDPVSLERWIEVHGRYKSEGWRREYNRISNIASKTISLTGAIHGTGFDRTRGQQTQPKEEIVVSGTKPFEKPERVSVFKPKETLSQNTLNIINGIQSGSLTVPSWFMNNVTWVKSGQITETEFINAYNFLAPQKPEVTTAPIPQITIPSIPEVSAEMELITTNFQVKLDNIIQFSSSLSNADYKRLQDEMSQEPKITLVFLNQTDFKPLSNFYNVLRKIQKLLEGQIVETVTISPTGQVITAPEPTVTPGKTGLMGAGVLGLIGILMLGGFIADHVRRKR